MCRQGTVARVVAISVVGIVARDSSVVIRSLFVSPKFESSNTEFNCWRKDQRNSNFKIQNLTRIEKIEDIVIPKHLQEPGKNL